MPPPVYFPSSGDELGPSRGEFPQPGSRIFNSYITGYNTTPCPGEAIS